MALDYFSILRQEMLAGLISDRDSFEQRMVALEVERWPDTTRVTRGRLVKFMEHCFEYARTPYHGRYEEGIRLLGMLFQWAPGLVDLMQRTGEHMIANMLIGEGKTGFRIPDRFALTVFLLEWERFGFPRFTPDDFYSTLLSKKRVRERIADDDLSTLARLRALFPDIVDAEWSATRVRTADEADESAGIVAESIQDDLNDGQMITAQIAASNELAEPYRYVVQSVGERYCRNQKLVSLLKAYHSDRCQWCGLVIPTASSQRYSEVHHVISLADGGADRCENMLVLCPNHHVQMHHCLLETPLIRDGNWQITTVGGELEIPANLIERMSAVGPSRPHIDNWRSRS